MELRHLRYFTAVAELASVSHAARKLRVAQPALSRQIRDLEAEIGVPLLERNSRGVKLTEAGRAFAREAREVLSKAEAAMELARATARGETGVLHLGYAPSPTAELLPRALHAFQNEAPNVRIELHDNSTEEMVDGLRDGRLQIAMLVRPTQESLRGLVYESLLTYPMCVAVSPKHPLARSARVGLKRILQEKLIVYSKDQYHEYDEQLQRLFGPLGSFPEIAAECDSGSSLIAAVESMRGVAIVPSVIRCLASGRIRLRPLHPFPAPLEVGFAYLATSTTPRCSRFIEVLRQLKTTTA
jgi:DNA-binding transcriptional LysR family regulator